MEPMPLRKPAEPLALHDRAMDDLRFIRQTMERAGPFTAVPGWGGVAMGVTALVAGVAAASQPTQERWLWIWLVEAVLAMLIAIWATVRKSRRAGAPLLSGSGQKFMLSFMPMVVAGGALTLALYAAGALAVVPGSWLLLYGAGVVAAGTSSVRVVPVMGVCFMLAGVAALASPAEWRDVYMAVGFGGLHVLFGALIAWRYGG
jgi:hypothetical protein